MWYFGTCSHCGLPCWRSTIYSDLGVLPGMFCPKRSLWPPTFFTFLTFTTNSSSFNGNIFRKNHCYKIFVWRSLTLNMNEMPLCWFRKVPCLIVSSLHDSDSGVPGLLVPDSSLLFSRVSGVGGSGSWLFCVIWLTILRPCCFGLLGPGWGNCDKVPVNSQPLALGLNRVSQAGWRPYWEDGSPYYIGL